MRIDPIPDFHRQIRRGSFETRVAQLRLIAQISPVPRPAFVWIAPVSLPENAVNSFPVVERLAGTGRRHHPLPGPDQTTILHANDTVSSVERQPPTRRPRQPTPRRICV